MKYKITRGEYDKNTGISTVTIDTKIGTFTGTSKIRKEDLPFESIYFGCQIAEMKAVIKMLKKQKSILSIEKETLERFRKISLYNCGDFDTGLFICGEVDDQIINIDEKRKELDRRIAIIGESIVKSISSRDEINKKKEIK